MNSFAAACHAYSHTICTYVCVVCCVCVPGKALALERTIYAHMRGQTIHVDNCHVFVQIRFGRTNRSCFFYYFVAICTQHRKSTAFTFVGHFFFFLYFCCPCFHFIAQMNSIRKMRSHNLYNFEHMHMAYG